MKTLDGFTRGYIGAALWSSTDEAGEPLDAGRDASDVSPETVERMAQDCEKFQQDNADALAVAYANLERNFTPERAGFCFWLNRNGYGSGFWDEVELTPELQTALSEAAHTFGTFDLMLGDDGKIYGG